MREKLEAVGLGHQLAAIEGIEKDFLGRGLVAANEMAGQTDAGHWQPQSSRQQQIKQAQVDGIAGAPIHDAVQVAVLRIVISGFVSRKTELIEQVFADHGKRFFSIGARIDALTQFIRVAVQHRLVRLDVDVRIGGLHQQPHALFQVKFLAVLQAKGKEPRVRVQTRKMPDDFLRATAEHRIAAERMRTQPFARDGAAGENSGPDGMVDRGVVVRQQIEQRGSFASGRQLGRGNVRYRIHRFNCAGIKAEAVEKFNEEIVCAEKNYLEFPGGSGGRFDFNSFVRAICRRALSNNSRCCSRVRRRTTARSSNAIKNASPTNTKQPIQKTRNSTGCERRRPRSNVSPAISITSEAIRKNAPSARRRMSVLSAMTPAYAFTFFEPRKFIRLPILNPQQSTP